MESGCAHGHLPRKQSTEVGPPKVTARVEPLDAALGQGNSANESGRSTALGFPSWRAFLLSFGFFKDADSNIAPAPYPGTAVGASDETLICRMVWDDESIAAALRASEGGVRHGACRPFWPAFANLVSPRE